MPLSAIKWLLTIRAGMQQMMATEESKQVLFAKFREKPAIDFAGRHYPAVFQVLRGQASAVFMPRKDMVQLYETYTDMGGNSYVKTIYDDFMEWPVRT